MKEEEGNTTKHISGPDTNVMYGLGPAVVSVSIFDDNAEHLQYVHREPIRISLSIKVNSIP